MTACAPFCLQFPCLTCLEHPTHRIRQTHAEKSEKDREPTGSALLTGSAERSAVGPKGPKLRIPQLLDCVPRRSAVGKAQDEYAYLLQPPLLTTKLTYRLIWFMLWIFHCTSYLDLSLSPNPTALSFVPHPLFSPTTPNMMFLSVTQKPDVSLIAWARIDHIVSIEDGEIVPNRGPGRDGNITA